MVSQLFSQLADIITGLISAMVSSINGVVELFYDSTNGFTFLGSLLLIGFGLFFVMFAWRVIQGLIKR